VSIPPSVLSQYQSVTSQAQQTAQNPFVDYSGQFVAPITTEQQQGISATTAAANQAQPANEAAEAGTVASAAPISGADINSYLSPYLGDVMSSTEALQNQSNQQQQAGQLGNAITSGAFGSDRTGIAAANLEEQQNLANSSTLAGIANTGYQSALGEANTEQQAGLAGSAQLANIGNAAQASSLSGASAELAAGTVQQQTQQAQDTAEYNQFEQQQSYPFQVDQFLAGIAEGTGSLSGSTTTTTQPGGFFSDRRLKRDIKKIGETFDHQDVVTYKMGDDNRTRIGLIAQDVEKKHPEAVGVAGGYKTVDYGKATKEAANEGHFYTGGVVAFPRKKYASGGYPGDSGGLAGVLQAQQAMYGQMGGGQPGMSGTPRVPGASSSGAHLTVASGGVKPAQTGAQNVMQAAQLAEAGDKLYKDFTGPTPTTASANSTPVAAAPTANIDTSNGVMGTGISPTGDAQNATPDQPMTFSLDNSDGMKHGGIAGRAHFDSGGSPYGDNGLDIPDEQNDNKLAVAATAPSQGQQNGMNDVADIASIVSMFANRGGAVPFRHKRDMGGGLNIPDNEATDTLATAAPLAVGPAQAEQNADMQDIADVVKIAGAVALLAKRGGRINGYADGGDPTDDDADTDDTAPAPTDAAPASTGVAASPPSLWDKIKGVAESPGVLAALEGIGAMGTARTVHPGVALAAGLEAAAGAYPGIQEGLASAQQKQAQTRGIDIQNTILGMRQAAGQKYLASLNGVSPPVQPTAPTGGGVAGRVPQAAAPAPTAGPTATTYGYATGKSPVTGASAPAIAQPGVPQRVASAATGQSQVDPSTATAKALGQQAFNKYWVNTARTPEELAKYNTAAGAEATGFLTGTAASEAANIAFQNRVQQDQIDSHKAAQEEADGWYAQATDPDATPQDKATALAHYNAVWQFTGDQPVDISGSMRNSRTSQPLIGTAAQTLTPQQQGALALEARGQNIGAQDVVTDANGNLWNVNKITHQRTPVTGAGTAGAGAGTTAPSSGNYLPNINFSNLPQTTPQSGFATTSSQITPQKTEDFRTSELGDANDAATQDAKTRSIIAAAQNELTKIPPRVVGPGSNVYNGFQRFYTAVSGAAPDALVNEAALDKYLNQLGAQNVRSLLSGQKITNQEMMTFMTRGSPNVAQPIGAVQNLVNYLQADTDYDARLQATKIRALENNADPWALPGAIDAMPGASRASYVQSKLGYTPPSFTPRQRPGQSAAPTIVRTGVLNGRKVAKYSDGTTAYVQ
jgi:hypothetical protein